MDFENLCAALAALQGVEALALGGSRAGDHFDDHSDYDLYVYCTTLPSVFDRQKTLAPFCCTMEIDNRFWETEDDCTLNNGIDIDIIYRTLEDFEAQIMAVTENAQASCGYTTCLWHNLKHCRIVFDANGWLAALKKRADIPYPELLAEAILDKNLPLLKDHLPSYDRQLAKAVKRNDPVSILHRSAAYFESYFDILFALNRQTHPGEKRMIEYALKHCPMLPADFCENIERFSRQLSSDPTQALNTLDAMSEAMFQCVRQSANNG